MTYDEIFALVEEGRRIDPTASMQDTLLWYRLRDIKAAERSMMAGPDKLEKQRQAARQEHFRACSMEVLNRQRDKRWNSLYLMMDSVSTDYIRAHESGDGETIVKAADAICQKIYNVFSLWQREDKEKEKG